MNGLRVFDWASIAARHVSLRLALILLLMVLIGVGGYFARVQGTQATLQHVRVEAERMRVQLQAGSERLQQLGVEQQALADAETRLRDTRWGLAAGEDLSDLLEQLTLAGHEYGLSFEQMQISRQSPETDYHLAELDIRVEGRYPALQRWLDDWLGRLRLLRVTDMSLTPLSERPGMLQARLKVETFDAAEVLPVPASLADQPAKGPARDALPDLFQAWSGRALSDGLERVPLEQLQMVGSLSRAGHYHALLAAAGRVHRVGVGDRLGGGEGRVVHVDERQVVVRERLYAGEAWQKRSKVLLLRNSAGDEGKDDRESMEGGVAGSRTAVEGFAGGSGPG